MRASRRFTRHYLSLDHRQGNAGSSHWAALEVQTVRSGRLGADEAGDRIDVFHQGWAFASRNLSAIALPLSLSKRTTSVPRGAPQHGV